MVLNSGFIYFTNCLGSSRLHGEPPPLVFCHNRAINGTFFVWPHSKSFIGRYGGANRTSDSKSHTNEKGVEVAGGEQT